GVHTPEYLEGLISPSVYAGNDFKTTCDCVPKSAAVIELYQIT
ncbi:hypothetical protein GBF38_001831, partial [Nibea albiflora]